MSGSVGPGLEVNKSDVGSSVTKDNHYLVSPSNVVPEEK
jgi:hypothetical protein